MAARAPHAFDRSFQRGTTRADQFVSGDPFEVSNGHAVQCLPTGGRGSQPNRLGASVVGWDPAVREAGVDTGYSPEPGMLRAPDVAVGNVPDKPGWVPGVPDLAIEYADVGQDEEGLTKKIGDLLEAGTKFLWVVRLVGPRRVEVHQPGKPMVTVHPGGMLTAPGVLKNPVRVEALYDRDEAERATLTNLLQRRGFESIDAVFAQGRREGHDAGVAEGLRKGHDAGVAEGLRKGHDAGVAEGLRKGHDAGVAEGLRKGHDAAIRSLCEVLGIVLDEGREAELSRMSPGDLEGLLERIKRERRW